MRTPLPAAARNPVMVFLAAGLLALVVVTWAISSLSTRAARTEAVRDARSRTDLLARSVVEPLIPVGLVKGGAGAVDRLDRAIRHRHVDGAVDRLKVWRSDGTVLYSDRTALIGQQFPLGDAEQAVLDGAPTAAEVSDLSKPENRFERGSGGLLEVYSRVSSPEGHPLLFEVYYPLTDLQRQQREISSSFRPIALSGLLAVLLVATALISGLWRRVLRGAREREHLLVAAVEASDGERRRIARDLHDGVVQDLTATAYRVSAATTDGRDGRAELVDAGASLRRSLRSLRSLLVEIYPPDLSAGGLQGALDDLLVAATERGLSTRLEVDGVDGCPDGAVGLVWRVAQEAVRNTLRHANARTVSVAVTREPGWLVLRVTDDGKGFDPTRVGRDRLGLRGLRDLAADSGAQLQVTSTPGEGTDMLMRVEAP